MGNPFKKITSEEQLDDLIDRSKKEPVAIFKHSTTCPISASAFREMKGFSGDLALVEVQNARELSRQIGTRTGIEHESPQVIVLRNGKAVWHASHWEVTADAVAEAMRKSA
jgi:bacillithiol system protein YtxJ